MVLDPVISAARRGALAYVGALALTRDLVSDTVEQFAERGAPVERAVRSRVSQATSAARQRLEHAAGGLRQQAAEPAAPAPSPAGGLLAQGRDRLLGALSIPTQRTLHDLSDQVDHLGAALDELRAQRRQAKAAALPEPLPGYDKMNVDTVVRHLAALEGAGLRAVRAYEQEHGKRVTVLRAVEERLALAPTV